VIPIRQAGRGNGGRCQHGDTQCLGCSLAKFSMALMQSNNGRESQVNYLRPTVAGAVGMHRFHLILFATLATLISNHALAIEGPTAAGPIGGTDIRSAMMPSPGFYGGINLLGAGTLDFVNHEGQTIPALSKAHISKEIGGPFFYYVFDTKFLGGSIGVGATVPAGNQCGRLFTNESSRCSSGVGDPYVEVDWSRSFGTLRQSKYSGAYPILEGLTILAGFGMVVPAGTYDAAGPTDRALSIGNGIWDFAPAVALTYTTPPLLAEGTEFSAKFYWNNYLENPNTHFTTGDLLNLDFAITERIGRFQVGPAGFYALQIEDDGIKDGVIPADQRRAGFLYAGGVINYDMPEYAASAKLKVLSTVFASNTVKSWGVVFGWFKKF